MLKNKNEKRRESYGDRPNKKIMIFEIDQLNRSHKDEPMKDPYNFSFSHYLLSPGKEKILSIIIIGSVVSYNKYEKKK